MRNLMKIASLALIWQVCTAGNFPSSPCSNIFKYEDSTDPDRWYGEFTFIPNIDISGLQLRITLDRPAELLAGWSGPVLTQDNQIFISFNPNERLPQGRTATFRIMVKFDPSKTVPYLQSLHLNSRRICPPADSPLSIGTRTPTYNEYTTTARTLPNIGGGFETAEIDDRDSTISHRPTNRAPVTQMMVPTATSKPLTSTTLSQSQSQYTNSFSTCGLTDLARPLITQGMNTERGQWPWHVAIYKTEGVNLNYKCGATLVSKNKVITAAHCVSAPNKKAMNNTILVLYLGKHKLHQFIGEEGVQTKQVSKISIHPAYNSETYYGDIAVLTLSADAEYTKFVRPACLWEYSKGITEIEGKEGSVVGWGLDETDQTTENLKLARLPVVSLETCLTSFPAFYSQFTNNGTFCAGTRNGTSPCNGDSGGGLVINRNNIWYLRGIVSLSVAKDGQNYCDPNHYVIFTDVAKFRDFINKNL